MVGAEIYRKECNMSEESLRDAIIKLLDAYNSAEDDWEEEVDNLVESLEELVGYNSLQVEDEE